jgi:CheY-like chemotaxis protein
MTVQDHPENQAIDILLIEDNRGDIDLILECLEEVQLNNHLHAFREGAAALAFLRKEQGYLDSPQPNLILLDLNLPALDGREILAEIKTDPSLKHIPVVVFTSSASQQDIRGCYALHANSYIVKPSNIDQYLQTIQSICDYWFTTVSLCLE